MALFALAGMALFLLASIVVGARLVGLWTRTHQLPELLIGLSFLLAGGIGGVASTAGAEVRGADPELALRLLVIGNVAIHAGVVCLVLFTGRVFRPDPRGMAWTWAAVAALAVLGVLSSRSTGTGDSAMGLASTALRIAVYVWVTTESFLEWRAARRRQRLGLAAPAVVNRYLLWAVGTGAIVLLWVHSFWRAWRGESGLGGTSYLVIAALGMVCAVSIWLAFFPPRAWLRRLAGPSPDFAG